MPDFDVQKLAEEAARAQYRSRTDLDGFDRLIARKKRSWVEDSTAALAVIVPAVTEQIRTLHRRVHLVFTWNSGLHAEEPCPECDGKAGEWPCGCWGDYDIDYHCLQCSDLDGKYRVPYPCPTVRLLDELDAAARGEQP